jgi:hypothetical protein
METTGVLRGCEKCSGSVRAGVRSEESDAALLRIRGKNSSARVSALDISSLGTLNAVWIGFELSNITILITYSEATQLL